eukprot:CAMPEP_0179410438 /NCGR_PEP_ID=MMETSP0799-20121207/3287_1 /TAXON_ID=46947 /ORGANISM="Geminigera cryophila, Strain CCMP2564" /LENGTH=355 /DNA_ID=CAMNT_0021182287 /DNA_START=96 /DNA_END=1159 /DNA_ORIENTATION=+
MTAVLGGAGEGHGGKYVLIRHLNSGGYGSVYEAQDTVSNRRVAIKKSDLFSDQNDINDQGVPVVVFREGCVLCKLTHPNVVRVYDVYIQEGHHNFVLELCACNLREYMGLLDQQGQRCMEEAKLQDLMWQMLSGVEYCHDYQLIHRDIKPDNILMNADHTVAKLADFGMNRMMRCKAGGHYTDRLVTHWYRPPEIILGSTQYDTSVDIWSMGCVLVEMMMLCPAFACNTEIECLMVIFQRFGTPDEEGWPEITNLPNYLMEFPKWQKPQNLFHAFGMDENSPYVTHEVLIDLTERMLAMNPRTRISASDCLHWHTYLAQYTDDLEDTDDLESKSEHSSDLESEEVGEQVLFAQGG